MSWFHKLMPSRIRTEGGSKRTVPEGLWTKCDACAAVLYRPELERNLAVCPKCSNHMPVTARTRLEQFLDQGEKREIAAGLEPSDPLKFRDSKKYRDRIAAAQKKTGEKDALVAMAGKLAGHDIVACAFEFGFMGGSMGSVVGEKFATTGGVSASLGMLGDVNIAEPGALIGFAGPRVIEQTVREKLPEGFQRSEFLLEKGAIDMIVDRRQMRDEIASLLSLLTGGQRPRAVRGEVVSA